MDHSQPGRLEVRIARELLLALGMALLALVQVTLLPAPLGIVPDVVLVVVVCRVLVGLEATYPEYEISTALRWAFYSGIALDVYAASLLGSHVVALLLAAVVVMLVARNWQTSDGFAPLLSVILGTLVYQVFLALVYHLTVARLDWSSHALFILLPSSVLTLIPTLPVFHLMRWRYKR